MRTAVRALLLAAVFVLVPISAAHAGPIPPDGQLPYSTTTKPSSSTTTPTTTPKTVVTTTRTSTAPQGLASTGSDSTPLVWAGVAALAVGGVLVIGARRRASVRR